MSDAFNSYLDTSTSPARAALAITPSDTTALADIPKAIYVGTGGTIVMRGVDGVTDQSWKNVPSGALIPFRGQYVRATGTTAADLLALY